jgi:triosephosphate isomerase (TIM)
MRRPLIVGNWKMNGTRESAKQLLADLLSGLGNDGTREVGVCVPYVFIPAAAEQLADALIALGAQNVGDHEAGAFTGEVSASMLKEFGCRLAIVGHSERRALYYESDELVAARYSQSLAHDIRPILCVGETLEQREGGKTFDVVDQQLSAVLDASGAKSLFSAVIAYEPVWAIGTGVTASVDQAQEVHAFIRNRVAELDKEAAEQVRILYGGSVKPDNAAGLFAMPDIDGGLIGGASLDADAFLAICAAAQAGG